MNNYAYVGVVKGATLDVLVAEDGRPGRYRLTGAAPGEDASAAEIRLTDYDHRALLVRGIGGDGWIHAASIVEAADGLLTLVVSALFAGGRPPDGLTFPSG